jgi:MFS family permease
MNEDYSWLSSIFYFGYLISQYPAGYFLQRLPLGRVIGVTTVIWGILIITTPACNSFGGIATNRFLLGVFEAVVNPGFVLVMAMWYRADEQPLRLVIYYCECSWLISMVATLIISINSGMNGVAGIFGGLLGYAIGHITTGLEQWMYMFASLIGL